MTLGKLKIDDNNIIIFSELRSEEKK